MKTDKEFLSGIYNKAESYKQNPPDWFKEQPTQNNNSLKLLTNPNFKKVASVTLKVAVLVLVIGGVAMLQSNFNTPIVNPINKHNTRVISPINEPNCFTGYDIVAIVEYNQNTKQNEVMQILKNTDNVTGWETTLKDVKIKNDSQSIVFLNKDNGKFNVLNVSAISADKDGNLYYITQDNFKEYIYK